MRKNELEKLMDYWDNRSNQDSLPERNQFYAMGYINALNLVWKAMYSDDKFSLQEWTVMEGPTGVFDK